MAAANWVRVGGASASVLQGSPTYSELLLAHLLGDNTPLADSVRPTSSPQLRDLVSKKPCSKSRKPGLAVSDRGGASFQRKGDSLANQDTCLSALRALRQVILTSGSLLKEDIHKVSSFCTEALTICNSLLHPCTPSLSFPLTLKPPQASNLLGGPAPGPPFPSSLDNRLPLVLPGLSGGQRPVFILYDKEEASDVEISLESDSDDCVVIVPQRMLMLESQDGTSAAATLPGSSLAPGGVTLPMPCPRGDPGGDISLPLSNDLPSTSLTLPSSTPNYTVNLFPPAPLVSLASPVQQSPTAATLIH
ncbi:proline-, glutamic acid- and leucine-rich protein 1 [Oncorhynchus kisutch]|uniref:proline-, glutamic acid- and leucine-rich protein 1 n=1 Tax=Oncorhynchus kisutch TaxID=8019 RepID=UPI0012DC30D5|nr:proline-, glutamic acid- and leucine-rich protein 1 [Oncorhynchus kisutch]